jgi:hypothetical protein
MPVVELQPFRTDAWTQSKSLPVFYDRHHADDVISTDYPTTSRGGGHLTGDGVVAYRSEEFHDVEKHAAIYRELTARSGNHSHRVPSATNANNAARIDLHPKWRNYWSLFQPADSDNTSNSKQQVVVSERAHDVDTASDNNERHLNSPTPTGYFVPKTEREKSTVSEIKRKEMVSVHNRVETSSEGGGGSGRQSAGSRSTRAVLSRTRSRQRAASRHSGVVLKSASYATVERPTANHGLTPHATAPRHQQVQHQRMPTSDDDLGLNLLPINSSRPPSTPLIENGDPWRSPAPRRNMPIGLAVRLSAGRRTEAAANREAWRSQQMDSGLTNSISSKQVRSQLDPRACAGGSSTHIVENYLSDQLKMCLRGVRRDNVNALWLSAHNPYRTAGNSKPTHLSTIPRSSADVPRTVIIKDPASLSSSVSPALNDVTDAVSVVGLSRASVLQQRPVSGTSVRSRSRLTSAKSRTTHHQQRPVCQSPEFPSGGIDQYVDENGTEVAAITKSLESTVQSEQPANENSPVAQVHARQQQQQPRITRPTAVELKQNEKSIKLIVTTRKSNETGAVADSPLDNSYHGDDDPAAEAGGGGEAGHGISCSERNDSVDNTQNGNLEISDLTLSESNNETFRITGELVSEETADDVTSSTVKEHVSFTAQDEEDTGDVSHERNVYDIRASTAESDTDYV